MYKFSVIKFFFLVCFLNNQLVLTFDIQHAHKDSQLVSNKLMNYRTIKKNM